MNLGRTIKLLREYKDMEQKDLANRIGISRTYMCLIESDKKDPSLRIVRAIADELGVSLGYLFMED